MSNDAVAVAITGVIVILAILLGLMLSRIES